MTSPLPETVTSRYATFGGGGGIAGCGDGRGGGGGVAAATFVGESTTSRQRSTDPEQPPAQCDPEFIVSVTSVPDSNEALQAGRQSMPLG